MKYITLSVVSSYLFFEAKNLFIYIFIKYQKLNNVKYNFLEDRELESKRIYFNIMTENKLQIYTIYLICGSTLLSRYGKEPTKKTRK